MNTYIEQLKKEILPNNKRSDFLIRILEKRLKNPAKENINKHHIFPRSWGGPDRKDNFVKLTISEHFKVHQLLYEVTIDKDKKSSMQSAYWLMINCGKYKIKNHKEYQRFHEEYSAYQSERVSGKNNPLYKKSVYILKTGEKKILEINDPLIINNEAFGVNKGFGIYILNGETIRLSKNDIRVINEKAVGINKGFGMYKTQEGEILRLESEDPRVLNGEVIGVMKNKKNDKNSKARKGKTTYVLTNGECKSLYKDDPLVLSGEAKHVTNGKKLYILKNGTKKQLLPSDPLVLNGEAKWVGNKKTTA